MTEINWDESAQNQPASETDTADTIEKVLNQRRGRKGGKKLCTFQKQFISSSPLHIGWR